MFTWRKPADAEIKRFLQQQAREPFSYDRVGCTAEGKVSPRNGWNVDRCRVRLGTGRETFERAQGAIKQWRMFPSEVAQLCYPDCPVEAGATVAVLYRLWLVCWILMPAKIVYTLDDEIVAPAGRVRRFGFAYGTLPDHPERGEERFLIEWHAADDSVWYDLLAVSQPAHPLARLGYPYTRWEQARFRRWSTVAMQSVVAQ